MLSENKHGKTYSANVDFYSGLTYAMLGIPKDMFTALFALARTVGWVAHVIETLLYCNKIIRPASKYVGKIEE
jgi:citrate synthase